MVVEGVWDLFLENFSCDYVHKLGGEPLLSMVIERIRAVCTFAELIKDQMRIPC